jgi:3-hydroxyisobutyrate dehydrogenase-like beta-hydroxyacid dehydrogenase
MAGEGAGVEEPVGFVGLGAMGHRMARRLLDRGIAVCAYDVRAEATSSLAGLGAEPCSSALSVADAASVVLASVPTPDVVREVACGPDGLAKGSRMRTFVDLSTTGAAVAEEVAGVLEAQGIGYVDAPVSGGTKGAEAGTLAVMAAGAPSEVELVRPLLEVFGPVFVVGEHPGQGQVAKVANNLLSAAATVMTSEAVLLGVKAGLDPRVLLDVFNAGSGRNTATSDKFPRTVLPRSFDVGFRLSLMVKDLRLCRAEAQRRQSPLMMGSAIEQLWSLAEARLPEGVDSMWIVKLLEEWAGAEIATPPTRSPAPEAPTRGPDGAAGSPPDGSTTAPGEPGPATFSPGQPAGVASPPPASR